jgi:hypothetical protein
MKLAAKEGIKRFNEEKSNNRKIKSENKKEWSSVFRVFTKSLT